MEALKKHINNSKVMQLPDIFHSARVARLTIKICEAMGITDKKKDDIVIAAILHDIGKSMVDKEILNKPGKLDNKEWQFMKLHSEFGAAIATVMGLSADIVKNILYHHENRNGTGYPKKTTGNSIPIGAAIIRVCDSYDAMRTTRPYKKGYSHDEAINELIKDKDKYNPKVLKHFLSMDFERLEGLSY